MAEDETTHRAAERDPVSVTDLLGRRPGAGRGREPSVDPEQAPIPAPRASEVTDTGQLFVTELLRREGRVDDEGPLPARPSWICRLVAALACFALLFGAVVASTAALSGPRTERAAPSSPVPASIEGARAMRPDLINASVAFPPLPAPATGAPPTGDAAPAPPVTETEAAPLPPPTARTVPDSAPPKQAVAPPPPAPDNRPTGSEGNPVLATVRAFYQQVAVSPRQAFALLDPQMRGSGYKEFRSGWTGVERVTLNNIRLDGPNAALVTVSLERSDGTVLHTLQRVQVTPGAEPRITDARLLSASRS